MKNIYKAIDAKAFWTDLNYRTEGAVYKLKVEGG